jgi:hypothetical protein
LHALLVARKFWHLWLEVMVQNVTMAFGDKSRSGEPRLILRLIPLRYLCRSWCAMSRSVTSGRRGLRSSCDRWLIHTGCFCARCGFLLRCFCRMRCGPVFRALLLQSQHLLILNSLLSVCFLSLSCFYFILNPPFLTIVLPSLE